MTLSLQKDLRFLVETHLRTIYSSDDNPEITHSVLARRLIQTMELDESCTKPAPHENLWSESDILLITYGDSIRSENETPLDTLSRFLHERLSDVINCVHILPFFPYSSDDGFSVIEYTQVNDSLGDWEDIEKIARDFHLMADLVLNHCSSRSRWFDNFKQCRHPGADFFVDVDPATDLSDVVRPRTSPLLREVETLEGKKHVWCTFSHDQVDLNFSNPEVLCEFIKIIKVYLDRGVKIFRLDAVAFLWKEIGTPCINHPKTHEIIRLIRTLIEHHSSDAIIITETNIPHRENLAYLGNANEAHAIYNFSLPPLLINALVTGSAKHLQTWQMSVPPSQAGTFYLNFIASHDGIGLRPVEGLLSDEEIDTLISAMHQFGARISWRTTEGGKNKPYEINITLFDAMLGTTKGPDRWQLERFLCAHAIMLALEGLPAIYIHSFLATNNYIEGVELTNQNRTINRFMWDHDELVAKLEDEHSHHAKVFRKLCWLIKTRKQQPAFHPNAAQFPLHLGDSVFGFWRQAPDQTLFCINNVSDREVSFPLSSINLTGADRWTDLVSENIVDDLHRNLILKPYQYVWLTDTVDTL